MSEFFSVSVSIFALVFGALVLRKLWLGAAIALMVLLGFKLFQQVEFHSVISPLLSGMVISFELALLLFGALFFYQLLEANDQLSGIKSITQVFSSRVSVLLVLCYFLASFMEGIAGFGLPAMLIAPLMLVSGFKPLTAIVLPLAANTTAVTFGALGTPLKIGLGIFEPDSVVFFVAVLNVVPALLMPFMLTYLYEKTEQTKVDWHQNKRALWSAGILYAILYMVSALFTIEYVSAIAGILGLMAFVVLNVKRAERPSLFIWIQTFRPYLLFVALLLLSKYFLAHINWTFHELARPLSAYQPGLVFVLSGFLFFMFFIKQRDTPHALRKPFLQALQRCLKPVFTILVLVCFAQLIRSDLSLLAYESLGHKGDLVKWIINPVLGIAGSFISGSATMSNLIFSDAIKVVSASSIYLPLLLAMLHTGSAIGNAISLQNILMVKSVVRDSNADYFDVLRFTIRWVGLYFLLILMVSMFIMIAIQ